MKNRKITILIADDHSLMRVGIRSMLEANEGMVVVGESRDGLSVVKMAKALEPDIVIMDLMMPKMGGAQATEKIMDALPQTRVIILTSFGSSAEMAKAIQAGAVGALLKESPSDELINAINAVMDGKKAIHREVAEYLQSAEEQPVFTERQLEILSAVVAGDLDKTIAARCHITIAGVRKHLEAIMTKVGAVNRAELISITLSKRLLKT